jgi:hypothetical protein
VKTLSDLHLFWNFGVNNFLKLRGQVVKTFYIKELLPRNERNFNRLMKTTMLLSRQLPICELLTDPNQHN